MKNFFIVILLFAIVLIADSNPLVIEQFDENSRSTAGINGWKENSFLGHTQYSVQLTDDDYVLNAEADSAASALYKEIDVDLKEYPVLSWRWKAVHLPEKGNVHTKETDDYGARVYVVFPEFLKWNTKTINYIWARELPKGESIPNAWLPGNAVMIAAQSGKDSLNIWIREKHNVYEDYKRIFGKEPPHAKAVAVMTDADNTGGKAEAFYDDFLFLKE